MQPEPRNDRGRPGEEAAPEIAVQTINAPDIVADNVVADEWSAAAYRHLSQAATDLCAYCVTARRHPDTDVCIAELEPGAGDTWSGDER